MTKRRNFSDKFKATVALEAQRGDKTVQEIAATAIKNSMMSGMVGDPGITVGVGATA